MLRGPSCRRAGVQATSVRQCAELSALVACVMVVLAGCAEASPGPSAEERSTSSSPTATATATGTASPFNAYSNTVEKQVLRSYRAFWAAVSTVATLPASSRAAYLPRVAVDPVLRTVLAQLSDEERRGEVRAGDVVLSPTVVSVSGDMAVLRDCQDRSQQTLISRSTGSKVDTGPPRQLQRVGMVRGTDGIWRTATVEPQPGSDC